MRRKLVVSANLVIVGAFVAAGAWLVHRHRQNPPAPQYSAGSYSRAAASRLSDRELLEAVATSDAPWDLEELKARGGTYSATKLDEIADMVVELTFTLDEDDYQVSRLLNVVPTFLPQPLAGQTVKRAYKKRQDAADLLEKYVKSQQSPDGSHTPEDAERLYRIYVDLSAQTKYPQVPNRSHGFVTTREMLKSWALDGLAHCGAPGLEKLRKLDQSGRVLALALLRTGRPEDIEDLHTLCRQPHAEEDRLAYLCALAKVEPGRRTEPMCDTLREGLTPFFGDDDPLVRNSAVFAAADIKDAYFLPILEELAAGDPYHRTDRRGYNTGTVDAQQTYERYTVREVAASAVETIRMLDPDHRAMREAEEARRRRLSEIRPLELNAISLRRDEMNALHDSRPDPGTENASAAVRDSWQVRFSDLAEQRNETLNRLADLRDERAQVLKEEDLDWRTTDFELLRAVADGNERATDILGKRCALYSEEWLEELSLMSLDVEERNEGRSSQRLATAVEALLPVRIRGPVAEYRAARDGDFAAKMRFAKRVKAGMTTGRLMVTLLCRLYLQIGEPTAPDASALAKGLREATSIHGQQALFLAPSFLAPSRTEIRKRQGFALDSEDAEQLERLQEYQELREKVCQIDYELADVGGRDWVVPFISAQRAEARDRMDTLWGELRRAASSPAQ
ncbi:MAG: hypothetical protein GY851_11790 [bacterium]|nr:hypothetical protein [bacterium]